MENFLSHLAELAIGLAPVICLTWVWYVTSNYARSAKDYYIGFWIYTAIADNPRARYWQKGFLYCDKSEFNLGGMTYDEIALQAHHCAYTLIIVLLTAGALWCAVAS